VPAWGVAREPPYPRSPNTTHFADYLDEEHHRKRKLPPRKPRANGQHASASDDAPILPALAELSVQDAVDFARWLDDYFERERGRAPPRRPSSPTPPPSSPSTATSTARGSAPASTWRRFASA
jgi:hypothetical protein